VEAHGDHADDDGRDGQVRQDQDEHP